MLQCLTDILETGAWLTQQRLLYEVKRSFTAEGYGDFKWHMARFSLNFAPV
jgi:hypothetical protein